MNLCIAVPGLTIAQRSRLEAALAAHTLTFCAEFPEFEKRAAVATAHVIFGNVPAAWLSAAAGLRWVQLESAGVDAYLGLNATPRAASVVLTNLAGFYDRAVAEAALAGILAFYRQLPRLLVAQPAARWIKSEVEPAIRALAGQRVLLLGAGGIARRLARVLAAFDAEVQFFSRTARTGALATPAELDAALVTTHHPITNTRHKLIRTHPKPTIHSQSQRVYKKANKLIKLRARSACNRKANNNIILTCNSAQKYSIKSRKYRKARRTVT